MKSFSPELTSVKSSIIFDVFILNQPWKKEIKKYEETVKISFFEFRKMMFINIRSDDYRICLVFNILAGKNRMWGNREAGCAAKIYISQYRKEKNYNIKNIFLV